MTHSEITELYNKYKSSMQNYIKQYQNSFEAEFDKAQSKVVREEFCTGSDMMLGYYCPSPVFDLITGNVHRGKILKRITKRSKPCMQYGFSESGRILTFVELATEDIKAYDVCGFAVYEECKTTYICFRKLEEKAELEWIVQAEYDEQGRIVRYTTGTFGGSEISEEIYTYSENGMEMVTLWACMSDGSASQDEYKLHHDNDGYLTGYEALNNDYWKGHIFEIAKSKRRKI